MSCRCNRCNQNNEGENRNNSCRRALQGITREACEIGNQVERLEALVNNLKARAAQAEERCLDNDDDDDDDDNGHCGCRRSGNHRCHRQCGCHRQSGCGSTRTNNSQCGW